MRNLFVALSLFTAGFSQPSLAQDSQASENPVYLRCELLEGEKKHHAVLMGISGEGEISTTFTIKGVSFEVTYTASITPTADHLTIKHHHPQFGGVGHYSIQKSLITTYEGYVGQLFIGLPDEKGVPQSSVASLRCWVRRS